VEEMIYKEYKDKTDSSIMNLEIIKTKIENMSKFHHIEILKILKHHSIKLNENKSGVYINLSFLCEDALNEVKQYLSYIEDQETTLASVESQRENLLQMMETK